MITNSTLRNSKNGITTEGAAEATHLAFFILTCLAAVSKVSAEKPLFASPLEMPDRVVLIGIKTLLTAIMPLSLINVIRLNGFL